MLVKNKSAEFGKEFWKHVETVSQEVSKQSETCECGHKKSDHNWLHGCVDEQCPCGEDHGSMQKAIMDKLCIICGKRRGDHARGKCVGKQYGTWFKGKNE